MSIPESDSKISSNILGKYRLLALIGQGGMADVFLASSQGQFGFSKLLVLKMLKRHLSDDPNSLSMFIEESKLASMLMHPNIVQTVDAEHINDHHFMVMEYLEGQPLSKIIKKSSESFHPFTAGMYYKIICGILQGLHYAHNMRDRSGKPLNIVHRDVSPHNIFVTYDGQIKLIDFGIAKSNSNSNETETGVLKGKINYMSPEQLQEDKVDKRSDIFAVGVILWEIATEQRLWKNVQNITICQKIITEGVPDPSELYPDKVDKDIAAICNKATHRDPSKRYQNCLDLHNDLVKYLDKHYPDSDFLSIGDRVSNLFDIERASLKNKIDKQLNKISSLKNSGDYSVASITITDAIEDSKQNKFQTTYTPISQPRTTHNPPIIESELYTRNSQVSQNNINSNNTNTITIKKSNFITYVVGMVFVVSLSSYLFFTFKNNSQKQLAEIPHNPTNINYSSPATPSITQQIITQNQTNDVTIKINSNPQGFVFIDGVAFGTSPIIKVMQKDNLKHKLIIKSNNYIDKEYVFSTDSDIIIDLMLDKSTLPFSLSNTLKKKDSQLPPTSISSTQTTTTNASAQPISTTTQQPKSKKAVLDKSDPWN